MTYLLKTVFNIIPNHRLLFRTAARYVDRYNSDNNSDPSTNGEYHLLSKLSPRINGAVVFDVGSNIGDWACYALSVAPDISLHCFEPSAETYKRLELRQFPASTVLNCSALSDKVGESQLFNFVTKPSMNSLYDRQGIDGYDSASPETIQLITGDDYCAKHDISSIAYLKIDVEGHEINVLRGFLSMLKERRIQMVQFEYGGCNLDAHVYLGEIFEYLSSFGYQLSKLFPGGPRMVPRYTQTLETFKYSNWLAELRP